MNILSRRQVVMGIGVTALAGHSRLVAAQALKATTSGHPVNTGNYITPLVAAANGYFKDEGLDCKLISTGGGTKLREMVAAGEAAFGLGDASHALQLINRNRPAMMLMTVDNRSAAVNVVIRRDLYEAGITTVEKLAAWSRPRGEKPIVAVATLGGGIYNYTTFLFDKFGGAEKVNFVAGGVGQTMLGGLQTKKFDVILALPAYMFEAEAQGWGKTIFNTIDLQAWNSAFGGAMPSTVFYCLQSKLDQDPSLVQAYVTATYRAQRWIRDTNAEGIYDLLGERYLSALNKEVAVKEIEFFKQVFDYNGTIDARSYAAGSAIWFRDTNEIKPIGYDAAVDGRFIAAAHRRSA